MTKSRQVRSILAILVLLAVALLPIRFGTSLASSVSVELPIGWYSPDLAGNATISRALCGGINMAGPDREIKEGFPFSYHRAHIYDCGEGEVNNLAKALDYLVYILVLTAVAVAGMKVFKRVEKHE
jgi:hypothetical protein